MKHTRATLLLALSLCAPGMAQTKGKPATTNTGNEAGSTSPDNIRLVPKLSSDHTIPISTTLWPVQTTTLQPWVTIGDAPLTKISSGTAVVWSGSLQPPPITIDGESADCTQPHLIKALKIAAIGLRDPNKRPFVFWSGSTLALPDQYVQSYESRSPAERLRAEADRLEAESKRVQWVRAVLAGCEK